MQLTTTITRKTNTPKGKKIASSLQDSFSIPGISCNFPTKKGKHHLFPFLLWYQGFQLKLSDNRLKLTKK